jgi:hypothetical protein
MIVKSYFAEILELAGQLEEKAENIEREEWHTATRLFYDAGILREAVLILSEKLERPAAQVGRPSGDAS